MSGKHGNKKNYVVFLLCLFLTQAGVQGAGADSDKTSKQIPSLNETIRIVLEHTLKITKKSEKKNSLSREDIIAATKQHYYELQFKKEQLKVADEVKGYFEKAVSKAEEKFEEGDTGVSQSSLTKLKLGLSGTENDIIKLSSEMYITKLSLGKMMGWEVSSDSQITDDKILPLEFKFNDFGAYLKSLDSPTSGGGKAKPGNAAKSFDLHKAFIKVMENRDKMNLADKQKKMTRALLVTESANYDFGVGNSEDLFQALIIYTRVLSGYYESLYNFNMAVVELEQTTAKILGSPFF